MDNQERNRIFERYKKKAGPLLQNNKRIASLLSDVNTKISRIDLKKYSKTAFKEKIKLMARMLKAYKKGIYKEAPWKTILMATTALLYFVMPLDAIPDFIPIAGFLDDFTIVIWVFNALKDDIHAFEEWEHQKNDTGDSITKSL